MSHSYSSRNLNFLGVEDFL